MASETYDSFGGPAAALNTFKGMSVVMTSIRTENPASATRALEAGQWKYAD
jgi:hypothetical protein